MKKINPKTSTQTVIVLDLEFLCEQDRMQFQDMDLIRIGAAKWTPRSQEITYFDSYVKPKKPAVISAYCEQLTGITQTDIDGAEPFSRVYPKLKAWAGEWENALVLSWGENDLRRLRLDLTEHGWNHELTELKKAHQNLQKKFYSITGTDISVETALSMYGCSFEGTKHEPKWDAHNTLRIYRKLKTRPHYSKWLQIESRNVYLSKTVREKAAFLMDQLDEQPSLAGTIMYQRQMHQVQAILANEVQSSLKKEIKAFRSTELGRSARSLMRQSASICKKYILAEAKAHPLLEQVKIKSDMARVKKWHRQYEAAWEAQRNENKHKQSLSEGTDFFAG